MTLFSETIYIGVDPTAGRKPITYSALDGELQLIALGTGNTDEISAYIAGQSQALVAICSPASPNIGLMEDDQIRYRLIPPPKYGRWRNYRVAEYLLRQHNIHITSTGKSEDVCAKWIRVGFSIYRRLRYLGYQPYPTPETDRQYLEVYPQAAFAVLLGHNPLLKNTLEGRLQRQLILYENNLHIPDPMNFFEELTRYRIINGIFPTGILHTKQELDSLVAAYCAWLAHNHADRITLLGEPKEGQIILPGVELKHHY